MQALLNAIVQFSGPIALVFLTTGISFFLVRTAYYRKKKVLTYDILTSTPGPGDYEPHRESKVIFWNHGNQVIRHEDFASHGQLHILSQKTIYGAELLECSDEYSQINFSENGNGFYVAPEYIEKDEAFVLSVNHHKEARLQVAGKLINGIIARGRNIRFWYKFNFGVDLLMSFMVFAGYLCFWTWLIRYKQWDISAGGEFQWLLLLVFFTTAALAVYLVMSFDNNIRKIHRLASRHFHN